MGLLDMFSKGETVEDSPAEAPQGLLTVQQGDTLSKLAAQQGLPLEGLLKANPEIQDPNMIQVGQELKLPKFKMATPEEMEPLEEEEPSTLGKLFQSQSMENLLDAFNPFAGDKTEKDYSPDVMNSLRTAATNALAKGKKNIDYEDYGHGDEGRDLRELVTTQSGYKGGVKRGVGVRVGEGKNDAAHSIGGATIVEEDGDIYITDTYDFSRIKRPTLEQAKKEPYIAIRWLFGELSDMGALNEYKSKIKLGKKEEIMPTTVVSVKSGDSLSKLAKQYDTTVDQLVKLNGIKDKNKIRSGDRLRVS